MLLKLVKQEMLPVDKFVTHRFAFDDVISAYETFGKRSADWGAQGAHQPLTQTR
jgi:threonine dehydrogenase-like Zn-dependent dehydrogenase